MVAHVVGCDRGEALLYWFRQLRSKDEKQQVLVEVRVAIHGRVAGGIAPEEFVPGRPSVSSVLLVVGEVPHPDFGDCITLQEESDQLREFAMKETPNVEGEISQNASNLVIVSDEPLNIGHLIRSSLYVNQYIFNDPLLPLVERLDRTSDAMNRYLGMKQDDGIDRGQLTSIVDLHKSATPFVAGN